MQQKRFAIAAVALALAAAVFTVGFFVGRGSVNPVITVSHLQPPASGQTSGLLSTDAPVDNAPSGTSGEETADSTDSSLININTATATELEALPGIGAVLAERIVQYRQTHGGFAAIHEIKNVSGIGDGKFADIKDLITTD